MEDLTFLKAVGSTLDRTTGTPPPRLRHRVVTGFRAPAPRTRRLRLPRLGWSLATTGGLAAALAVAIVAGNTGGSGQHTPGDRSAEVPAEAGDILLRAAQTARMDPTPIPRADQFVYVESIDAYPDPARRQVWLSADGTHDGLIEQDATAGQSSTDEILPGCHNGKAAFIGKDGKVVPGRFGPCLPTPAYRPGLPTDADGMLRHLRNGKGALTDADLFKMIADLLRESYLSPPQRAAVFEAASRLSGAVVVNDVADAAGRHGVAVAWTLMYPDPAKTPVKPSEGPPRPVAQDQLIFDKASYGYLGERTVFTADVLGEKAGAVDGQSAVLKVGIVDRVGQRP